MIRYADKGDPAWRPLLFFGGIATSVRAFELTEFARTLRERLALRVISVERDGLRGFDDVADDVLFVLEVLQVDRAAVVAISGGGPYAAALAARIPDRLISLHLAAAVGSGPVGRVPDHPIDMWRFPQDSPVHRIPGFDQAARQEGARVDGALIDRERRLLSGVRLPSLARVVAPSYLYWGTSDEVVPLAHAEAWQATLGGQVTLRLYEGEAHDVQYSHWDQILLDAAGRRGSPLAAPASP